LVGAITELIMIVSVINKSSNKLPQYETSGAAGLDICCAEEFTLDPTCRHLVKTGLYVEIPYGYELQVRPRSGLALNHGITVLNSPGTIDADYRGEIGVILINHGPRSVVFHEGDRIAQLVLCKVERVEWHPVASLTGTKRGDNGFGSTGGN
jgi:dUTP pyrophosphatase